MDTFPDIRAMTDDELGAFIEVPKQQDAGLSGQLGGDTTVSYKGQIAAAKLSLAVESGSGLP